MTKEVREKLAQEVYQNSVDHGFWEHSTKRNKFEQMMLIITELSEAVEAHREDIFANIKDYNNAIEKHHEYLSQPDTYMVLFERTIKNSVEDELADAWIRCADYCIGWKKGLPLRVASGIDFGYNFAENIYKICQVINSVSIPHTLLCIEDLANRLRIDLQYHIELKAKYNSMRPHKHGKNY